MVGNGGANARRDDGIDGQTWRIEEDGGPDQLRRHQMVFRHLGNESERRRRRLRQVVGDRRSGYS